MPINEWNTRDTLRSSTLHMVSCPRDDLPLPFHYLLLFTSIKDPRWQPYRDDGTPLHCIWTNVQEH
uniref:Uncharacterized protein n=1 Tax=Arundo donax TaxID=35708 RepID=A0A0A8XN96_ARUDO